CGWTIEVETNKIHRTKTKLMKLKTYSIYLGSLISAEKTLKRNLHKDRHGSTSLQQTHQHLEIHYVPPQDRTDEIQIQRPFSSTERFRDIEVKHEGRKPIQVLKEGASDES
ncbi:hypothetical protein LSAT2_026714, partial [Lamellibrachia satsuma]